MGEGPEPIADKQELQRVQRSARNTMLSTTAAALAATALFLIPG